MNCLASRTLYKRLHEYAFVPLATMLLLVLLTVSSLPAQDIWQSTNVPPTVGSALTLTEDGTLLCGTPVGIFRRTRTASSWTLVFVLFVESITSYIP